MPVRRWSNGNSPSLVAGMHGTATFEDSLEVSYETKHTLTIQFGPLEKDKSTHSNILAWRIPWTL